MNERLRVEKFFIFFLRFFEGEVMDACLLRTFDFNKQFIITFADLK